MKLEDSMRKKGLRTIIIRSSPTETVAEFRHHLMTTNLKNILENTRETNRGKRGKHLNNFILRFIFMQILDFLQEKEAKRWQRKEANPR